MQVILFTDVADTPGYGKYAGTYKVATEIRKAGYTCQVVDLFSFYSNEQLTKIVDKFCTKETVLVGFSCTLMEKRINGQVFNFGRPTEDFEALVEYIKTKNNKVKICLGGARMTKFSYWRGVDYVIINKGDTAIIALLNHLTHNTDLKISAQHHANVIDGNDYFYTQTEFSTSSIIYTNEDIIFHGESLPIEIARGCIFKCAFCHFDLIGKKIGDWQKTEESIKYELIRNYELFGTTHFMFTDELINESLPKMQMLHKVMTSLPFKATYTSYARIDLIHRYPEMRELLLESGAGSLAFGIETFNSYAGKKIGKGLDPVKVKETLEYCAETWKGKIITSSNFIVGLPGETEQSIWETVDYLTSKNCPLDVFGFLPLYIRENEDGRESSAIDKNPEKFGYKIQQGAPWQAEQMDFSLARKITYQIHNLPSVKQKNKFAAATWIGRIVNLGYTIEDIFKIINSDVPQLNIELESKSYELKSSYYTKLLNI